DWNRAGTAGRRRRRRILVVNTQRHSSSGHVERVDGQEAQPVALVARLAARALGPISRLITLEAREAGAGPVRPSLRAESALHPNAEVRQGFRRGQWFVELQEDERIVARPLGEERRGLTAGKWMVRERFSERTDVSTVEDAGRRRGDAGWRTRHRR